MIELSEWEIAPLLFEYATEDNDYDECFDGADKTDKYLPLWDEFEQVHEETTYWDLEKAYNEITVILKRISDNKYFKGNYTLYYYDCNIYDTTLLEVFPREKTIIVYE